jgi:serine/threonine-protein kinase
MSSDRVAFGKHHVLARLGRGGMGDVYLAVHFGAGGVEKLAVIKQLRADLAELSHARSMFLDEARIATRLNHPNIVQTSEVVEEGDDLYLVMDFLDGQPLSRILGRGHRAHFTRAMQLRIVSEALAGLHYAHELHDFNGRALDVVHRDVSPQNILVTYDGHVKLVDFGVAKAAVTTAETSAGTFKGKVRYAAPEQALCKDVDRRADIFAMGVILWEILNGKRMWQEKSDASVLIALASDDVPRDVPRDAADSEEPLSVEGTLRPLRAICHRALARDPIERFATALEMRNALEAHLRATREETDLGAAMGLSFDVERRELHAVIDAQVRSVREVSVRSLAVRSVPVLASEHSSLGGLPPSSYTSAVDRRSSVPVAAEVPPPPVLPLVREGGRRGGATIGAALLCAVVVLAAFVYFGPLGGALRAPAAAGAAPAPPARVHVRLHASPPAARLYLDGDPLPTNPYEADVPRDDLTHAILVQANGFETQTRHAAFAQTVDLDVTLQPSATPAVAAAPKAAARPPALGGLPATAAHRESALSAPRQESALSAPRQESALSAPRQESALSAPPRAKRTIDEEDPYAQ